MSGSEISAYFVAHSHKPGDTAKLCISADCGLVDVKIVRQGSIDLCVEEHQRVPVEFQPVPDAVVSEGCGWQTTLELEVGSAWTSGFYLAEIRASGRLEAPPALAFFVLRPAQRTADIVLCLTTSTWEAYNDFGGANAYSSGSDSYSAGAPQVSRHRPMAAGILRKPNDAVRIANVETQGEDVPWLAYAVSKGLSIWSGGTGWWNWEWPFVRWAEAQGYTLDYICSDDLDRDPSCLEGYSAYLSVGHDEYWSWEMRDTVEIFARSGGNVIFLSGNTAFWQVRWNEERTQMTTYKSRFRNDPVYKSEDPSRTTGLWSNPVTGRPENSMTGLSFTRAGYARMAGCSPKGLGGYIVERPEHWVFEGTGLRYGDVLGRKDVIIGYEVDGCAYRLVEGRPVPTGEDGTPDATVILGTAPAALMNRDNAPPGFYPEDAMTDQEVVADQLLGSTDAAALQAFKHGRACLIVEDRANGGFLFNSGATDWTCGLAGEDPDVDRITRTVLDRALARCA